MKKKIACDFGIDGYDDGIDGIVGARGNECWCG